MIGVPIKLSAPIGGVKRATVKTQAQTPSVVNERCRSLWNHGGFSFTGVDWLKKISSYNKSVLRDELRALIVFYRAVFLCGLQGEGQFNGSVLLYHPLNYSRQEGRYCIYRLIPDPRFRLIPRTPIYIHNFMHSEHLISRAPLSDAM